MFLSSSTVSLFLVDLISPEPSICPLFFQIFSARLCFGDRSVSSTSYSCVPHNGLRPLAGWRASLPGFRCPSPARENRHAVLLTQAFVRASVGLDLLAQTAFPLNDFQQLAVSLGLR